jgi:hypothetical protein
MLGGAILSLLVVAALLSLYLSATPFRVVRRPTTSYRGSWRRVWSVNAQSFPVDQLNHTRSGLVSDIAGSLGSEPEHDALGMFEVVAT